MTAFSRGRDRGAGVAPGPPRVVIVGGGFGGLFAARALRRAAARVTLLDRSNHHLFQPLLYQVATASLSAGEIAEPLRWILRNQRNAQVLLADVSAVDLARRRVVVADGEPPHEISYDYLILATGSRHGYFGHEEWEPLAPGLKDISDAREIRERFLLAFELAERETDADLRRSLLTFVIVGGGPTGVELAGSMSEIARHTMRKEFRAFSPRRDVRILLLEGGPRILPAYPEELSRKARQSLARLGVEARTDAIVTDVDARGVCIGDERIEASNIFWAAGNVASPLARTLGVSLDAVGRVVVEPDLSLPGFREAFAVGDVALFTHQDGRPLPGVAPVAMQQGRCAAANIHRLIEGRPTRAFRYRDKGSLATIGRAAAVAEIGRLRLWGFPAWLAWLLVHIWYLIGFRNRLLVMFQWAWSYLTYQRGSRLITRRPDLTALNHAHPELEAAGAARPASELAASAREIFRAR